MREEPDIVKELKKAEKLGILTAQLQDQEAQQFIDEDNADEFDVTVQILEEKHGNQNQLNLENIEEGYRTIFENYFVGITIADEKERIIAWNKYAEKLLKMNEKDLFLRNVKTLYPEKEWEKIRAKDIRKKGMKHKIETKILMKTGKTFDAELSLCVLRGQDGKIIGSVGLIEDITKLKSTEKKLFESDKKYKTIFENSAVAITLTDENEKIVSWNKYTEKLLGLNKEDLYQKPIKSLYPEEEWKKIRSQNVRKKGMQHHLETKILRKDDDLLDVDISLSVLKDHDGKIIGSIGIIRDISKRKDMELKLEYERDLLQSLLDYLPNSIVFKDKECKFIKVNKEKAKHYNMSTEEMKGKTDFDILPSGEAKKIYEDDKKVMETGKPIVNKLEKITDKKGRKHWLSVTKVPRYDSDGKIIGTMGISHDVTELKSAEEEIRKSQQRYKNLFETALYPIIILDNDGKFLDVNEEFTKLLSYDKNDLIGKKFSRTKIIDKNDLSKTLENFTERMKGKKIHPYKIKMISKKGQKIPMEINANPIHNENKKIIGDLVVLKDLSESLRWENIKQELLESEKRFEEIFDSTSDFLMYIEKGIILDINNAVMDLTGLKKRELVGFKIPVVEKIFSDKNDNVHLDFINSILNEQTVDDTDLEIITKNGIKCSFSFTADIIDSKSGMTGIIVRGRDITQRRRAWEELVKLEEKYRILAETSADGVATIDPFGRLTYVNPSFEKTCGRRKSQILATLLRDYLSDDSIYLFQNVFVDARKKDEKAENVELELIRNDGTTVPIEANIAPLKKDNEFIGMICTVRDITERKKVEEELKKSERLKTEFMNIAAHELKSPVTPIKGYLDLIISDEESSEKVKNWAKISLRNSERLLRLVNDILDVSRLDTDTMRFDMEKLDTVELLEEIVEDMKAAIEQKGLELIGHIPGNLPPIMGDRYRLSQVFKNLVVNAIKFTDNGSIAIIAKIEGKNILISVQDSGIGISKDELKKIFTKFYQAYTGDDRKNEGTGLGLFICKEILEKHNAKIWAESEIRNGSTFTIKLPYI